MRRYLIIIELFLVLLTGCAVNPKETQEYRIISEYGELTNLLQTRDDNSILLDLRNNRDYENAHCIGSINVPFDDEGEWLLKKAEENGWEEKTVYLMCGGGKRSADAFNLLVAEGFPKVVYITFGYEEYVQAQGYENSEGANVCDCYQQ